MICYLFDEPSYLIFAEGLPELLYYSHIPATILALTVGLFVFLNAKHHLLNRLLLLLALCFTAWVAASLIAWTNIHSNVIAFVWPVFGVSAAFLAVFSVYFTYVFLYKKDVPISFKIIFLILLAPILLFAHTDLSLSGFDLTNCDAFMYEGLGYKAFYTGLGFLAMGWIAELLVRRYRTADAEFRKQIILMGIGIEFFLFSFITTTFLVTYMTTLGFFEDSRYEFFGLFGMMVFMVMMGVLIVRFKTFNVGMSAANALVIALLLLTVSQLTFVESTTSTILVIVTLVLTALVGFVLIQSVRKEIKQRTEIERLAKNLAAANKRLKTLDRLKSEFVSIASHQLRSPLTSIRGYSSMLIEGSFGHVNAKAKEALERIEASAHNMALSIEDYLNVSRIESGNMKYEMSDFNIKQEAEKITDDLRPQAMKKGVLMTFKSDVSSQSIVHADIGKTNQILHNLIHNALKYTPKGSITIFVHDEPERKLIHVEVIDTGIGMDPNSIVHLFEKFERDKQANKVNTEGTGLGLYVAKQMALAMKGDVRAFSEGEGKGSHFILTMPLAM